jgi:hypothetical protein
MLNQLNNFLSQTRDLAISTMFRSSLVKPPPVNTDWELSDVELSDIKVYWPVKYEWPDAEKWVEPLVSELRRRVTVEIVDLEQIYPGTVTFRVSAEGREHNIAVDYWDHSTINEGCLKDALVYFKMQYSAGGYDDPRVLPGGYVPDSRQLYLSLRKLRCERDRMDFDFEVYGRFSLDYARERREQAVTLLKSQTKFAFEGGLTKVSYQEFLRQVARSKICIDLPGNGDFCHRLVNYMAVGACIIGPPHRNRFHVPLRDREEIAFTKPDLSDLVDLCAYYLENDEEREKMCRASRRYFDLNLHRRNLSSYYLRQILNTL